MPAVRFESITQRFGAFTALENVTAAFDRGKIHAIVGENGAGKSTLMKILFGLISPTGGSLEVDGQKRKWRSPADAIACGLGMVQQHFTLVPTLSVIDNIILGGETTNLFGRLDRVAAISALEARLPAENLKLPWSKRVSELSLGEQQRVEILKLIARDAHTMVLDEPTAVLTLSEIKDLFIILQKLRDSGRTVFVITHKLDEVFSFCDTWTALRSGRVGGSGKVSLGLTDKSRVEEQFNAVVRAMVGSEIPPLHVRSTRAPGGCRLNVADLSTPHSAMNLKKVSLGVRSGEILGIAGVDGSGQAELIDCLTGLMPFSGRVDVNGVAIKFGDTRSIRESGVALISADRHHQGLWLDESVSLNTGLGFESIFRAQGWPVGWIDFRRWAATTKTWLADFDVRSPSLQISVRSLSGGNQQKLIFARELSGRETPVIICHQPTRGVDLGSIHAIHNELIARRDRGAAVLLVSSELDELLALSDRIVAMFQGRVTGQFDRQSGPMSREAIGRAMAGGQ